MRVEKQNYEGKFWRCGNPAESLLGFLTIDDGGKITVELFVGSGEFRKLFKIDTDDFRLHGTVNKLGAMTLDGCHIASEPITIPGIGKVIIKVECLVTELFYEEKEEFFFDSYYFSVDCLDEWIGRTGIDVKSDDEFCKTTVSYEPPPDLVYELGDCKFSISQSWSLPIYPAITEAKIEHYNHFKITTDVPRNFDFFRVLSYQIVRLLGFCIGQPVSLKSVSASHSEIKQKVGEKEYAVTAKIFYSSLPFKPNSPDISRFYMPIAFSRIENRFGEVLTRWREAYDELGPSFSLFFMAASKEHTYIDNSFLSLVQALESFHRRSNEQMAWPKKDFARVRRDVLKHCPEEFKERFRQCLAYGHELTLYERIVPLLQPLVGTVFGESKLEFIAKWIKDTRNYHTHYDKALEQKAAKGQAMFFLNEIMNFAYQVQLMQIIGLSRKKIQEIISESSYYRTFKQRITVSVPEEMVLK